MPASEIDTAAAAPHDPAAPLLLSGVPGSPYTRKMLALLRYRRIPYRLIQNSRGVPGLPAAKVPLLPTFYLPDDAGQLQAVTDSTPLIRRFEAQFAGRRFGPDPCQTRSPPGRHPRPRPRRHSGRRPPGRRVRNPKKGPGPPVSTPIPSRQGFDTGSSA